MKIFAAVQCGIGKEQCEDTALVGDLLVSSGSVEVSTVKAETVCVADGVGGNAGGYFASAFVIERLKGISGTESDKIKLLHILKGINDELLLEGAANGFPTAATTLTGIFCTGDKEHLVHIGNTRAYVLQGKYLKQLTTDHTVYSRLLKMGRIDEASQSRKNEITNCFGGGNVSLLESIIISEMQEFSTLLLTSDGVHDYVSIDELEYLMTSNILSTCTCSDIINAAIGAGSKDDISVVIVQK